MLLTSKNPLSQAEYFGVIFDKVPTYQEIKDGTQNASLVPDINQIFRLAFMPNVSMVGYSAIRWNTIEASLVLMYRKMVDLGFAFDGVSVVRPEEADV